MTFVCLVCRVFGSSASSEAIDGSGGAPGALAVIHQCSLAGLKNTREISTKTVSLLSTARRATRRPWLLAAEQATAIDDDSRKKRMF